MIAQWLDLEGAHNVRDLGGLPLVGGGATRHGVLLRADALDRLSAADVSALADRIGLLHVVDLRSAGERGERGRGPLGVLPGIHFTEVEVITAEAVARRKGDKQAAFARGADPDEVMAAGYVELLDLGGAAFRRAVESIAATGGTGGAPALFHCAAGKDRTGVLAALLLDVAGADREAIIADYALTDERMLPIVERLTGARSFEELAALLPAFTFRASPGTMERFLAMLDTTWGGAAGYLASLGVADASLERLRALLAG